MKRILSTPLAGLILGIIATTAQNAGAVNYSYTNTPAGTSGSWTNPANWNPGTGYPGNSPGTTDNADVNQPAGGDYTVTLDQTPAGTIGNLTVGNPSNNGKATVVLAPPAPLAVTGVTTLAPNGRLVIDGAAVTGGANGIGFGADSELVLNNGGSRVVAGGNCYVGRDLGGVTGLVTRTEGDAGMLHFGGAVLEVGNSSSTAWNCLRVENGVTLSNLNLRTGYVGTNHAVIIDNATVITSYQATTVGGNGGHDNLLLLDNGAVLTGMNNAGAIVGVRSFSTAVGASGNRLVVTNASHVQVNNNELGNFGRGAGTNNSIIVTGPGSTINFGGSGRVIVGNYDGTYPNGTPSRGNELRVENGGMVTNTVSLQVNSGPGFNNRFIVDNGKVYVNDLIFASNGRGCEFEVKGRDALVQSVPVNRFLYFADVSNPQAIHYFAGASNNVMRVKDGGTVSGFNIFLGRNHANVISNRLEVSNGGRVMMGANNEFRLAHAVSNAWGNAAVFTGGSTLATRRIYVNSAATGPVWDNFISFEDSTLLFQENATTIDLTSNAVLSVKNSAVGYQGVTGANIKHANFAKIDFSGDNAFTLSCATNNAANQFYDFNKGVPNVFHRLNLVDGGTRYMSTDLNHALTFGETGAMWCSNTTATVSLATTIDGTLTVLDSTVLFERGLILNGDLCIDTDATGAGQTLITVDNGLTLGPASRIFIKGNSKSDVLIRYTGERSGKFSQKIFLDAPYAVSYGSGDDSAITFRYTPPGSMLMVR